MYFGKATGSAIPLMWAHADFVKLLRSVVDKKSFDLIDPVAQRYRDAPTSGVPRQAIEVWKMNRQVRSVPAGGLLRIQASQSVPAALERLDELDTPRTTPLHADFARHRIRRFSSIFNARIHLCGLPFIGRRIISGRDRIIRSQMNRPKAEHIQERKVASGE